MEIHDMQAFAKVMVGLGELYGKPVSETLIDLYWVALKRFDIAAIHQAVNTHINNPDGGQFMPKPADIVRYLEGNASVKALQAWSKVMHAIRHVGQYGTLVFDDVLIHAVIHDMGGWIELCRGSEKELSFRGREFEKRYENYLFNRPTKYPNQLAGLVDVGNVAKGFQSSPPILIGDEESALQVYLGGQDITTLTQHKRLSADSIEQFKQKQLTSDKQEK